MLGWTKSKLTITSIGWGAKHAVKDGPTGRPVLRRYDGPPSIAAAPPIDLIAGEAPSM
jgi:hypothetical protein